jgi:hypothetical protein
MGKGRPTQRARGRLDSGRQIGFFVALGFIRFGGEPTSHQPPVTRAVTPPSQRPPDAFFSHNNFTEFYQSPFATIGLALTMPP